MSLSEEQFKIKQAAGRSIRASKAAATRKRKSASYERQARYDVALKAYTAARIEAKANGTKLPSMADFVPAGGF